MQNTHFERSMLYLTFIVLCHVKALGLPNETFLIDDFEIKDFI